MTSLQRAPSGDGERHSAPALGQLLRVTDCKRGTSETGGEGGGCKGGVWPPHPESHHQGGGLHPREGCIAPGGPFSGQGAPNKYPTCNHGCNPPPTPLPIAPFWGVTKTPHPPYQGGGAEITGRYPKHHKSWGHTSLRPGLCWGPQPPIPRHQEDPSTGTGGQRGGW